MVILEGCALKGTKMEKMFTEINIFCLIGTHHGRLAVVSTKIYVHGWSIPTAMG